MFILTLTISAQAPQGFNYQATVRNNAGALMVNQNVTFKFNVIKDTPTSVPVFSETHYVPTDDLGAVNLVIGKGTATTGTFATIDWATGTYYLGIELNTGNGFKAMGTSQLLSVPYALYAENSGTNTIHNLQDILTNGSVANLTVEPNKINAIEITTTGGNTNNLEFSGLLSTITGTNGRNNAITGTSIGINDYRNHGVVGRAARALALNTGVMGIASSETGHNYAVWGVASNAVNDKDNRGVMGYATAPTPTGKNYGVTGWAGGSERFNVALGGYADAADSVNGDNYGVWARASARSNNGTNYGIHATAANGATNYAGFFVGNVKINGNLDLSNKSIKNLLNPTDNQDAATKSYVDSFIGGNASADSNRNIAIATTLDALDRTTIPAAGSIGEYIPWTHTPVLSGYAKDNLSISVNGLKKLTTGQGNIAIGTGSLKENTNAAENTAVGYFALSENISNGLNTAFGSYALMKNSDWANTAVGHNALTGHVFGWMNVAMGNGAMQLSLDRNSNTAIGGDALRNGLYGDLNTAVGIEALMFNGVGLTQNSIISGSYEGTHNTGVGAFAMKFNTLGQNNSGLGFNVLRFNTTGLSNTAVGADAAKNNTTGSNNTNLGAFSFQNNTTGHANTIIGTFADVASNNLHNAIAIGANAVVTSSNSMQLGDQFITDVKTVGKVTASGFKTPNGTASQYLMADGSVSNTGGNGLTLLGKIIYCKYLDNSNFPTGYANLEIWTANYNGGNNVKINIVLPSGVFIGSIDDASGMPKMTPDGLKLIFQARDSNTNKYCIYSCNADGTNPIRIIESSNQLELSGVN